jgi:hypothetical protein
MMERIYQQSLKCKKGTWFVTMSKRLPHATTKKSNEPLESEFDILSNADKVGENEQASPDLHWEFILAIKLQMSWGKATVNVQRKRTHPIE